MLTPKMVYIMIVLWLFFLGFNVRKEIRLNLFHTSTKALAPTYFCQARRVKKNINSLSVRRFMNVMKILQRSALPLLLILLANDIAINPGPETSQTQPPFHFNDPDPRDNFDSRGQYIIRCLSFNARSLLIKYWKSNH